MMALTGERDADGSGGFGVFLRVIEQNFDHLPELCRVAGDGQIGGDVGLKRQLLLEEQGHPWNPEETARPKHDSSRGPRSDRGDRGDRGERRGDRRGRGDRERGDRDRH